MNLIGTALAGIYVVVASRSASLTSGEPAGSGGTGKVNVICEAGQTKNCAVSQPDTTVTVTCPDPSTQEQVSQRTGETIYVDANCSKLGAPSSVCPGATVQTTQQVGKDGPEEEGEASTAKTIVTLEFPQLPSSQQVICVKCPAKSRSESDNDRKALITVAAASPQGPQACAVGGTSVTLEINKAGGSAQFKCGDKRTLAPPERTKAYAEDCSKVEALKDMTRSDMSDNGYVTVKADKLKKKTLCYLCQKRAPVQNQRGEQDDSCKVYVHVSGSTNFPSSVPYGIALPCLAAMLRFT